MESLNKLIFSLVSILVFITGAYAQSLTAPGSVGNVVLNGDTETIGGSGTITFTSLELKANSILTIPSGVRAVVNGPFENKAGSRVIVNGELVLNGGDNENKGGGVIEGSGTLHAPNGIDNKGGGTVFGSTDRNPSCESGCSYTTLPVELMYFEGEFDKNVILSWATATEINNEYFSLERSENGKDFYEIARIQGHGNSEEMIEYTYEDDSYESAVEFYRLKQVDFDGQFEIFKAIRVETNAGQAENSFKVFPTVITQGKVTIEGEKPFEIKDIQIISLTGSSNVYQPRTSETTFRNVEVHMTGIESGLYLMKMVSENGNEFTSRIIVQ